MWRMQYVLVLVALYVGLAHSFSWDFVTASGSQLEFYFNEQQTHSENITSGDINVIIYDAEGNRMFFVDRGNTHTAIFSYDITTKKTESIVPKNNKKEHNILGIAFDPVEELLFWSEMYSNRIYWFSLKPGFKNNAYGNPLNVRPDRLLTINGIAVDSCRGYIYWTMTASPHYNLPSTIERARFDGSDREVLIDSYLQIPYRLVLDHQTQKLYWMNAAEPIPNNTAADQQFSIESIDLNGKDRTILYSEMGLGSFQPISLAVSKDYIYWAHWYHGPINQLSKNTSIHEKPKEISFITRVAVLETNYKFRGIQECEGLKKLLPNNSVTDDNVSLNISSDVSLFCVHGMKVSGKSQCQCTYGYTGERCDVSVCHNYCFQGDCIVNAEEQPTCRCNAGYSGERCQVNDCQGYCLNDGICSLNEESQPVCQCKGYYEGKRCDVSTCLNKCFQKVVSMVWGIINADVSQATLNKEVKSTCAPTAV